MLASPSGRMGVLGTAPGPAPQQPWAAPLSREPAAGGRGGPQGGRQEFQVCTLCFLGTLGRPGQPDRWPSMLGCSGRGVPCTVGTACALPAAPALQIRAWWVPTCTLRAPQEHRRPPKHRPAPLPALPTPPTSPRPPQATRYQGGRAQPHSALPALRPSPRLPPQNVAPQAPQSLPISQPAAQPGTMGYMGSQSVSLYQPYSMQVSVADAAVTLGPPWAAVACARPRRLRGLGLLPRTS